jgi:hypothetical protein
MKNALYVTGAAVIGLLVAIFFIQITSVPEVYADSSEISYTEGTVPIWAVKQIKNTKGESVPASQWKQILKGRYQLVLVSPKWQPSEGR